MNAQNCRVGRSVGKNGNTYILIERKRCDTKPCIPYGIIGSPYEGCENCDKTF